MTRSEELPTSYAPLEAQNQEVNEQALNRYAALFSELPDAALIINPMGLILDANLQATNLFQCRYRHLYQHILQRFIRREDRNALQSALKRIHRTGTRQVIRTRLDVLQNDPYAAIELHLNSLEFNKDINKNEIICVVIDLRGHERDHAELDLLHRRAECLLRLPQLANGVEERLFVQHAIDQIEQLTDSAIAFAHFVTEDQQYIELTAWSTHTMMHHCTATADRHYPISQAGLWVEALHQRQPVVIEDYEQDSRCCGLPDGHAVLNRLIFVPVLDGKLVRMIVGIGNKSIAYTERDVETVALIAESIWRIVNQRRIDRALRRHHRELAVARAQAEESAHAKSRFLANMSHEIRTPLNAIINLNQMALDQAGDDRQRDYLRKAQSAARKLLVMINDILDFSKIEAGKLELNPHPFDLREVLSDTAALMMGTVSSTKPLMLRYDLPATLPRWLIGDGLRLGQVLTNLLSNAVKFTPAGEVVLSVRETSAEHSPNVRLAFVIRDTGIGLTAEQIEPLFQAFYQVDSGIARHYGGTGLGLMISRQLVALMGGDLTVASRPNQGSNFSFNITLPKSADTPLIDPAIVADYQARRLLIVTSNEVLHGFIHSTLNDLHFQALHRVTSLVAAQDALRDAAQRQQPIEGLLLDAALGLTAYPQEQQALAAILHPEAPFPAPRIIVVTPRADIQASHVPLPAAARLDQPLTPCRLLQALADAMNSESPPVPTALPPARGARVLVVDDELVNRQVIQQMLKRFEIVVDCADNGITALERLRSESYALVLMDIEMPCLNGDDATRRLRTELKIEQLPVIAITSHDSDEDRASCLQAGMNDYLMKPLSMNDLMRVLGQWLDLSTATAAQTSLTTNLPALPGVDCVGALARLDQDGALYHKLLRQFYQHNQTTADQLTAHIANAQWNQARLLAHSLKGSAGHLGMDALAAAATALEQTLAHHPDDPPPQPLIDDVLTMLEQMLSALATLDDAPTAPEPSPAAVPLPEPSILIPQLQQLHHLLDEDMHAARTLIQQMTSTAANTTAIISIQSILAAIDEFDVDQAQQQIKNLIARLATSQ